jgi:uncharacterized membrane protein YgcG
MRRFLFALAALFLLQLEARADERIHQFTSEATVNVDGSLDVTETISINAEGDQINHGIYRDFPTTYTDNRGLRVVVDFDVVSVTLDGRAVNYALESLSNGVRVKIGDKDTFVSRELHEYQIRYRTTRQLGFFEDSDDLFWNATGNGWKFPIDAATAVVHLPDGAVIKKSIGYSGLQGEAGSDFRIVSARGNEFEAVTTRPLAPGEGLSISVSWQKGIVAPPTSAQKSMWFWRDNAGFVGLLLTIAGVGLYYLFAWTKVGRDPPAGTIVPLFAPPPDLGPAASRFIWKQKYDEKAFAASLVGLAVKGRLKIKDDDGDYEITKLASQGPALTLTEQSLFAAIPAGRTALKNTNHASISTMKNTLQKQLTKEYVGSTFKRNWGWFAIGALVSIVGLVVSGFLLPGADGALALFAAGWSAIWWSVILAFLWSTFSNIRNGYGVWNKAKAAFSFIFIVPFGIAGVAVPVATLFGNGFSPIILALVASAIVLVIINVVFNYLLSAPTVQGRKLLDQIEGFRMYLKTAEEDRLNVLNPPEKTPELFERYLPYALALDCENEWNAKFTKILAAAALAGATAPIWYSGHNWNSGSMGGFTNSLGSGLASSAASAATAPGSSSSSGGGFSGGGGSSGGGGGGGGGGGW